MPTEISGSTGVNKIQDNTIVNADINSSAAIAGSKISGSFGKVLQAVTANFNSTFTTTSHDFQDSDITLAITPSATSSKVLALVSSHGSNEIAGRTMYYTLYRGSTNLGNGDAGMGVFFSDSNGSTRVRASLAINLLDSPNTTSATTYTVKCRSASNGSAIELPPTGGRSFITLMEIGA